MSNNAPATLEEWSELVNAALIAAADAMREAAQMLDQRAHYIRSVIEQKPRGHAGE